MCAHTCVLMYVYNQGIRVEVRGQPRGQVLAFQSYLFVAQTSFCFVYTSICQARRPPPTQLPEWSPPISLRERWNCTAYY